MSEGETGRFVMSKAFGLVAILVAMYIGMTIYTKGIEHAFGGALAPLRSANERGEPLATQLTPAAGLAETVPTDRERRVWVTDAVREQVNSDLRSGSERRGY
jgi:hypothetical protein